MEKSEMSDLQVQCMYNILFVNDLVCSLIVDGLYELKGSPLYRHRVKSLANRLNGARSSYECHLHSVIKEHDGRFSELNDSYEDVFGEDLKAFRESLGLESPRDYIAMIALMSAKAAGVFGERTMEMVSGGIYESANVLSYLNLRPLAEIASLLAEAVGVDHTAFDGDRWKEISTRLSDRMVVDRVLRENIGNGGDREEV